MMFNRGFIGNSGCFGFGYFGIWQWLLVIGVVLIIFYFVKKHKKKDSSDVAFSILREKFAKGEISEDEYNHRRDLLMRK